MDLRLSQSLGVHQRHDQRQVMMARMEAALYECGEWELADQTDELIEEWEEKLANDEHPAIGYVRQFLEYLRGRHGRVYQGPLGEEGRSLLDTVAGPAESLEEHLLSQVAVSRHLDRGDARVAGRLISELDHDGYYRGPPLEQVALELRSAFGRELDAEYIEWVLEQVQMLDPEGCGARDLGECLLVQALVHHPGDTMLHRLLDEHADDLLHRRGKAILRGLGICKDELQRLSSVISTLEPRPGRRFYRPSAVRARPLAKVEWVDGRLETRLVDESMPSLYVHGKASAIAGTETDAKMRSHVRQRFNDAKWFVGTIINRQRTLLRIVECIVQHQSAYFEAGVEALRPLTQIRVAEWVGVDPSKVSRLLKDRYLETPTGLVPFSFFFGGGVSCDVGGSECASAAVREWVRRIIAAEPVGKPLSDEAIRAILDEEYGLRIARRTVAKYRDALGIVSRAHRRPLC